MDSYFKAAVCDLDKLLDEFEQNTDEYDCYRTPQNPRDSKHHSLSLVLHCLQHVYPTPKPQENANSCTSSEEVSLASHLGACEVLPSYSPQNEQQNVSGPDLLSTVDSSSLNKIQASNLGSCSVPVCDLVNDTDNLIHSVAAQEDTQKLQPDDFQYSESLIGFGVSCIPVPTCVSSAGGSSVSGTEQSDGSSTVPESGCLKTEEVNNLALKSDSYAAAKILIPCDEQHRTESVKCNEVSEQLEQTACLDMACVTLQSSNVYSPEDEKAYEKLICEPQDESAGSAASEETYGRDATEKVDSKDETSIEFIPADLPERPQLYKSHAVLSVNGVLPGSSFETGAKVELEKKIIEENVGTKELNSSEILKSVSTPFISVEDTQTPLLCFPLTVSICGSLVVTDEKIIPLPQNVAEVISGTLVVHAGISKTDPCGRESFENTDLSEPEVYVDKIHENIVEKSTDEESCNNENVIDDSDFQQIEAFTSASLDYKAELYAVGVDSYSSESLSPVMSDFTVEEKVIKTDTLISNAELDDFLYGQSLQSSVLKSSDDSNLMEADADEGNLINVNNLYFTELTEEHMQAKLEEITSISDNLEISFTGSESESAAEESASGSRDMIDSSSEALVPSLHTEGARPKQLLGFSHRAVGHRQHKITDVLERENQEASSVIPEAPLSGTSQQVGKKHYPEHSGESCSEAGGNQTSENVKSLKIPAVLSWKQPLWVPDSEAPNCMNCQVKFTFTKRRHHCRACGKVFCGACCKRKCKLQYMEKEARVCTGCYNDINKAQAFERMMSPTGPDSNSGVSVECSTVPPLEEAQVLGSASSPSPSASLPTPVLKQPGIEGLCPKEQRRVWFADGILPNGEVADTTELSSGARRSSEDLSPVNLELPEMHMSVLRLQKLRRLVPVQLIRLLVMCLLVLQVTGHCVVLRTVLTKISLVPDDDKLPPLLLAVARCLNTNLCVYRLYLVHWVLIHLDPLVEEHPSHGGFLFFLPTFQKLIDQILPDHPFLFGVLVHKVEIPWAKVFPICLMLRLGAEYGGKFLNTLKYLYKYKIPFGKYMGFRQVKYLKSSLVQKRCSQQQLLKGSEFQKCIIYNLPDLNAFLINKLAILEAESISMYHLLVYRFLESVVYFCWAGFCLHIGRVEYLAGSGAHLFPQKYLNELDNGLIPVIHAGMSDPTSLPLKMELIFFIIEHLV
uniref:Uncharacterized protein n=1 Tax=Melopsittacus undulatus TaxID=13146 RepID=A0A8C6K490_MELUD